MSAKALCFHGNTNQGMRMISRCGTKVSQWEVVNWVVVAQSMSIMGGLVSTRLQAAA